MKLNNSISSVFRRLGALALALIASLSLAGCIGGGGGGGGGGGDGGSKSSMFQGSGSATLSWSAPASRENGKPISLSEIDAYELLVGTSSGDYEEVIRIADEGQSSYTLRNLAEGTYYVAMRAADVNGLWSRLSSEVQMNIE